jgi:putative DNA primase/helicase
MGLGQRFTQATASSMSLTSRGKTRLQTVLEWLVPRPLSASNISAAAVYRTIEEYHPTLLMDEADTYAKENEELRGLLNAGHSREKAFVLRCHPVTLKPERFSVWCPKSLALIGDLPSTLLDRSIVVAMERKKRSEKVKPTSLPAFPS